MYVDLTKQEIINRRQYWCSKSCNSIFKEERDLFNNLFVCYDNLLNLINNGNVKTKEQNNVS